MNKPQPTLLLARRTLLAAAATAVAGQRAAAQAQQQHPATIATAVTTTVALAATARAGRRGRPGPGTHVRIAVDAARASAPVALAIDGRGVAAPSTAAPRARPAIASPLRDEVLGDRRLVVELVVRRQAGQGCRRALHADLRVPDGPEGRRARRTRRRGHVVDRAVRSDHPAPLARARWRGPRCRARLLPCRVLGRAHVRRGGVAVGGLPGRRRRRTRASLRCRPPTRRGLPVHRAAPRPRRSSSSSIDGAMLTGAAIRAAAARDSFSPRQGDQRAATGDRDGRDALDRPSATTSAAARRDRLTFARRAAGATASCDRLGLARPTAPRPGPAATATGAGALGLLVGDLGHRQVVLVLGDPAAGARRALLDLGDLGDVGEQVGDLDEVGAGVAAEADDLDSGRPSPGRRGWPARSRRRPTRRSRCRGSGPSSSCRRRARCRGSP